MNTYECMYIIQSNLSDDEADKANERIIEEIEKRGGSILQRERLGKKRLAYPVRKSDDGAYHLLYFELPPGEIASLRSAYRLHPRLLRMLILRKEREEIAKLQQRRRPTGGEEGATGTTDQTAAASPDQTTDDEAPREPDTDKDAAGDDATDDETSSDDQETERQE